MSFPSTSSAFSNFATTASPFETPARSHAHPHAHAHAHSVSFGSVPGSQPGVLSWGFGMSGANRGGHGWSSGGARMTPPPPPQANVQWGSQSPNPATSATSQTSRRRRRSDTPDSDDDSSERAIKPLASAPVKRPRKLNQTSEGLASGLAGSLSLGATTPTSTVEDLGKSLASLDKPALLGIVSSLLQSHPHLAPTLTALLPPPTLAASLDLVTTQTRQILSQIPQNSSPSYTLSRMRLALETFVQDARKLLSTYVPSQLPPSPPAGGNAGASGTEELYHPTTTMSFLLHLSASYLSISQALPASSSSSPTPLQAHLLPLLINSYHVFLTRLSTSVNGHGKILAQSTVAQWFNELDQVSSSSGRQDAAQPAHAREPETEAVVVGRRALEGVRDRMRKEIGWLVGIVNKPADASTGMEGVEEEEL
ncbi:hypothetical protein JCM3766R1_002373 [Sporobolomyces carnicolor]